MTESSLAELDQLVEAALTELVADEPSGPGGEEPGEALPSDPSVASLIQAAERLREMTRVQRLEAPGLVSRLEGHPESRARLLIDNHAQFQTWGLCEELIRRCQKAIFSSEMHRAVGIARLATSVGDRLDETVYAGGLASDLRARAWGALANALRCAGQLEASAEAFRTAGDLLESGSGDPLEEAHLLSLQASLAFWLGDLEKALEVLDRAETIYDELDEDDLRGKILIQKANAAGFLDPAQGVHYANQAQRVIDPESEGRHFLFARHVQLYWLVQSGKPELARMLLDASRALYRRHEDPWLELRRAGLEAQILFGEGQIEEAEAAFEVVLTEGMERELHLNVLVTALDLAACRLALGDAAGAAEIAAAMVPHLRQSGAHEYAREAWGLFQHALSVQRASQELIREVKTYLQIAWKNPKLRFRSRLTGGAGSL